MVNNFIRCSNFSLFSRIYIYVDTKDYLADLLLAKRNVRVRFEKREYGMLGSPYILVTCHVKKKDEEEFLKAMEELKNRMLLTGHKDYEEFCKDLQAILGQ